MRSERSAIRWPELKELQIIAELSSVKMANESSADGRGLCFGWTIGQRFVYKNNSMAPAHQVDVREFRYRRIIASQARKLVA